MRSVEQDTARTLLCDLVETPSVSGSEAECAARLREFFENHGRSVEIDDVGNVRVPTADSRDGDSESGIDVLLTSHMDTVPGEIPVRIEGGEEAILWGRGSVDAKGPLAALAVAAVETGASFAGVVQEETDSAGARHLVETRDPPDAVINGEPSGWDAITLGYRGFLAGTYEATSESGHTSRPDPNAIQRTIDWWSAVESAFPADEEDPVFEQVTAKPVAIDGGTTADGLAVAAEMDVQFRVPPSYSRTEIREAVEEKLAGGSVSWDRSIPPVMESPRSEVARALRRGIRDIGGEPSHLRKSGTSDMNIFAGTWEVPMATYGPGDSSLDHTPDERLSLAEFDRSIEVLSTAVEHLQT